MGEDEESTEEPAEAEAEQAESAETEPEQQAPEEGAEGGSGDDDDDQPAIEEGEQATIPENIEVSGEDIEEETSAEETTDDTDDEGADSEGDSSGGESEQAQADAMGADGSTSPVQAGELYVTVVQQATNAAIRSRDEDAEEVERDHFESYDLAHYFNETMDEMGVGSDLEPHEALVLATALAAGEPILTRTDVMDEQIGRLMDKAMDGGAAA